MRTFVKLSITLVTAVTFCADFASAQSAPWCANLDDGTTQCAFYTEQECLATVSGVGGQCSQNPNSDASQSGPSTLLQQPPGLAPLQVGPPPGLDGAPSDPGATSQSGPTRSVQEPGSGVRPSRPIETPFVSGRPIVVPNNLFTAAGFTVKYAITREKRALLLSLPPDKLVKRTKDGKVYYVYADATRCNCAYVGTPEAYATYQNWANAGGSNGGSQSLSPMEVIDTDNTTPDFLPSADNILNPDF